MFLILLQGTSIILEAIVRFKVYTFSLTQSIFNLLFYFTYHTEDLQNIFISSIHCDIDISILLLLCTQQYSVNPFLMASIFFETVF
jgi:hypothetical protein